MVKVPETGNSAKKKWRRPRRVTIAEPRGQGGPLRLIGYARVSTDEQVSSGTSLEAQKSALHEYAQRHGHTLLGILEDAGVSGTELVDERQTLVGAKRRIASGDADGLLFWKLDRLGRTMVDVVMTARDFEASGWHLVSATDNIDTRTPVGKMMLGVLATLAQMEVDKTKERTRMTLLHIARTGRITSFWAPFGWRFDDNTFKARPRNGAAKGDQRILRPYAKEQAILAKMQKMQADGKNAYAIAKELNASSTVNPRTGKPWATTSINTILVTIKERARREAEYSK